MTPRVCIYTAITAGYDDLKRPPEQTIACDLICFTDEPERTAVPPWRAVPIRPDERGPRFAAKVPKVDPHRADALAGYDVTIWIDGSVRILRPEFAERMVAALGSAPLAAIPHPERGSIYEEAEASLTRPVAHKYAGQRPREQVEHYRAEGMPHHALFAGGVLVRNMRDPAAAEIGRAWLAEIERWSLQDQLSLPYVLWKTGARCEPIDLDLWRNPLFEVWPHFDPIGDDLARRAAPEYDEASVGEGVLSTGLGVYDPRSGRWRLRQSDGGLAELSFGPAGMGLVPLLGDWDGDGAFSPGLYDARTGTFFLKNACADGPADHTFVFGPPGALPVAGDWDGDGRDSVGIFLPATGMWALTNRHEPGGADVELSFGAAGTGALPVAGDWDGRGRDSLGLYDPRTSTWFLLRAPATGEEVTTLSFGPDRALPLAGDWNGDGRDEIGVYVAEQGQAFLARANRSGAECVRVLLDPPDGVAVAGAWEGRSRDGGRVDLDLRNRSTEGVPERILPEDVPLAPDHVARYLFAAHWAPGCRVLDLCCGVGYGTAILAAAGARRVRGVDLEPSVVEFATRRYGSASLEFLAADVTGDLPPFQADLVTCFEGLEHVRRPDALLANMAASLAPGGVAIVSSPNGSFFPGGFSGNPYHVKEYTRDELTALLALHFATVTLFGQLGAPSALRSLDDAYHLRPREWSRERENTEWVPIVWVAVCRRSA